MKTIFETCEPRREVLSGELRDEMFAARLKDVVDGTADRVYGDPATFFDNTFPTAGLKALVTEVVGRLSGEKPTSSPFIRLETSFGGGKTHNLIALYHLAQGDAARVPAAAAGLVDPHWLPATPWPVAGVVGSDMDPANGLTHGSLTTRTLWGEIAYQLAGEAGYAAVRASDEALAAPGTQWLEELVGDGPALIMLDEIARYLRVAKAVATANRQSDLAAQTVAFLMSLIEYAASKPRVSVVITLADPRDAFGQETEELRQELGEAQRVSARQERVLTPTGETEISRIVTHRLFRRIDGEAAAETAAAYIAYFKTLRDQEVAIPERAVRAEYADEIAQSYPFHPELLNTLNRKTATIPNFQKTRGALRLLARVVRDLWERRPADSYLISVYDLNLDLDEIANDLTSRLDRPALRSVIEADITSPQKGSPAHCQVIDRLWTAAGKPPYARRLAITIFLHSLSQISAPGIEPGDLYLAVLGPGDDPALAKRALDLMLGEERGEPGSACWYLHWDTHRYSFKTEPSLEKVIQDELGLVGRVKAKQELDGRIRAIWKRGYFRPVFFPAEAADIDDDAAEPKLAVLHYDAATVTAVKPEPPELLVKLFTYSGAMQGFRTYKNNLLFLVADAEEVERMIAVAERLLAVRRIVSDADRLADFTDQQRKRLQGMHDSAELEVRVAITRAYRHLYYPSSDGLTKDVSLAHEVLAPQDQGSIESDQSEVVLRALRQLNKVLTADDPAMSAAFVKDKAWPHGQVSMTTADLRREFAKRVGLKILLDVNQLKKTIKAGVAQGVWVYFDSGEQIAYGPSSPAPLVELSDDALLYEPEEARRLGLRFKGEETQGEVTPCPLCGQYPCVCATPSQGPAETARLTVREEGPPAQVLQRIADRFHDRQAAPIATLTLGCGGTGRPAADDVRLMGLAIPQFGKAMVAVRLVLTAEFGEAGGDHLTIDFAGAWDRYKRLKQVSDALAQEASKLTLRMSVALSFAGGLDPGGDQFARIRDVLAQLGIGTITVEASELVAAEDAP